MSTETAINRLFSFLDELGIETTTHDHPAVFTVEEAQAHCSHLPGGHCKNLFLKDKKGGTALVSALDETVVNVKGLHGPLGRQRFSFGKPELLDEVLGVIPGSVTPFALINDTDKRCAVGLDIGLFDHELVNFHPLTNTKTTAIRPDDLERFIRALGFEPLRLDLTK